MSGMETTGLELWDIKGGVTMSESVKSYKKDAIKAARQLKYSDYILARLNNATTEGEICRLMIEGRHTKRYY